MTDQLRFLATALGGAVAALFLRSFFRLVRKIWIGCVPFATYDCGEPTEGPGFLKRGPGKRVTDPSASHDQAWEYQAQPNKPPHSIYGPYHNDLGKPGFYKVRFRISGTHFEPTSDPVISLDVIQIGFSRQDDRIKIGQRFVRSKQLRPNLIKRHLRFMSRYKSFDLILYAAGHGKYEYRAKVLEPYHSSRDYQIRFDSVRVYRHLPGWELF